VPTVPTVPSVPRWRLMNAFLAKWANLEKPTAARYMSVIEPGQSLAELPYIELCSRPPATAMAHVVIPPAEPPPPSTAAPGPSALKSQAVELWRDGKRFFVVTDDVDAQEAIRRFGARRGEIWTSGELELVARFEDQATRDAVEALKRELDGSLSQDDDS